MACAAHLGTSLSTVILHLFIFQKFWLCNNPHRYPLTEHNQLRQVQHRKQEVNLSHGSLLKYTERRLIHLNDLIVVVDLAVPELIHHLVRLSLGFVDC